MSHDKSHDLWHDVSQLPEHDESREKSHDL